MSEHTYPLVLVEWVDSYGVGSSWQTIGEQQELKPLTCYSVGWLVADNDKCIVIVPHKAVPHEGLMRPDGSEARTDGCGDMTIPKKAVEKVEYLARPGSLGDDGTLHAAEIDLDAPLPSNNTNAHMLETANGEPTG